MSNQTNSYKWGYYNACREAGCHQGLSGIMNPDKMKVVSVFEIVPKEYAAGHRDGTNNAHRLLSKNIKDLNKDFS